MSYTLDELESTHIFEKCLNYTSMSVTQANMGATHANTSVTRKNV